MGKLIEVWAEDGCGHISAWRRYQRAWHVWCASRGLSTAEECRLLPLPSSPWSSAFLIAEGRKDEVVERLNRAGVTLADIPALRAAARTHPHPE